MSDSAISVIQILIGFVALVGGGELLVRGASQLAAAVRISPLVIGLTVVAFGTSAPELAVTVQAAWAGSSELALGNVVGSNIANVLLILGISALIVPLSVQSRIVRTDLPLVIAASVGLWLISLTGVVSRVEGLLMFSALVVYVVWSIRAGRQESAEVQAEFDAAAPHEQTAGRGRLVGHLGLVVAGLVLLGVGANQLVGGAVSIARLLGVSELVIGLTIVAVGTSLPELVASAVAGLRGQRDIAVGNVVGSNLFNILGVLGLGAVVAPAGIAVPDAALHLDLPIMVATAVVCLPIFFTGGRISRREGALFLGYFFAYIGYVVMNATHAEHLRSFEVAMLGFVIPLTVAGIAVSLLQCYKRRRARLSAGGTKPPDS